jgi:Ca2+-binding RTX toxin-like protein
MATITVDTLRTTTVSVQGPDDAIITATGKITTSGTGSFYLRDTTATVHGWIESVTSGLAVNMWGGILDVKSNPEAKITATTNAVVALNGGTIINAGLISAGRLGIEGQYQDVTVTNSGTIEATNSGIGQAPGRAIVQGTGEQAHLTVTNSGIIKSAGTVITGGINDDVVVNTGRIEMTSTGSSIFNAIELGNGGDKYDGRNGGVVVGVIDLGSGNDTCYGGSGSETINGGTGADVLEGGRGDDTYYVDSSGDSITEAHDEGIDTVWTTVSIDSLAANVEKLFASGNGALMLTGNVGANTITGAAGADVIDGADGADLLTGRDGDDVLKGGLGNDVLNGGVGTQDKAQFTGARSDYTVTQGANGAYVVTDKRGGGDGQDTVSNIELFEFSGGTLTLAQLLSPDTGGGGGGGTPVAGQSLIGTSRANTLVGAEGNDRLYGKAGKDVLTGNAGQDIFVFDTKANTKTNRDTITDYSVAADTIWLSDSVFKKLGKGTEASPTKLKKAFFKVGSKATDKNDYLVYNKKTGVLSYDADGSGAGKAVEIAKLAKNLKLTQDDFFIV